MLKYPQAQVDSKAESFYLQMIFIMNSAKAMEAPVQKG